jgi:hypothetical protein
MRYTSVFIGLNAIFFAHEVSGKHASSGNLRENKATRAPSKPNETTEESQNDGETLDSKVVVTSNTTDTNPANDPNVPGWTQYTQGDRADWMKYMNRPGDENSSDSANGQFDWMKYAAPYMNQFNAGSGSDSAKGATTNSSSWNNGQGDSFGEPFRSQTGGDYRYKMGRDWNQSSSGGWQQFAAPYSDVNPSQPGQDASADGSSDMGGNGNMDYQKYMGGTGGGDWQQYMGGNGGGDWHKYMGGSANTGGAAASVPQSGGYFELEVSGTNLNVTTNFGLGQGHGGNASVTASGGGGGGGGNQNTITAKEGRIYIKGQFLNQMLGKDVVAAS